MMAAGLACGAACVGRDFSPNGQVPQRECYRVRWTGLSPHLAAALPDFLLPCGSNLLRMSARSAR
jgi:hypothetical protein